MFHEILDEGFALGDYCDHRFRHRDSRTFRIDRGDVTRQNTGASIGDSPTGRYYASRRVLSGPGRNPAGVFDGPGAWCVREPRETCVSYAPYVACRLGRGKKPIAESETSPYPLVFPNLAGLRRNAR